MTTVHKLSNTKANQSWSDVENSGMVEMISHYNLAKVLTALYRSGLINQLKEEPIKVESIESFNNYLLENVFRYLSTHGLLVKDEEGYYLTNKGKVLLSDESIAQLCFYSEAYAEVTSNIDKFLTNEAVYGRDIIRDGKSLGMHCDTLFKEYHTETVLKAISNLECQKILDIGCGGGQFLIDACKKSAVTGIGIDISEPAIAYARKSARKNDLEDRLDFVVGDAFDLSTWSDECFTAEILCGSGVIHEHFRDGEEAVVNILNTYSKLLSEQDFKALILGEPEIRHDLVKNDADLYLVHIFTAQGFPRYREQWLELFQKTKLKCEDVYTRLTAGPRFNFFVLNLR